MFYPNQLQDDLAGALIGLARCTDGNEHLIRSSSTAVIIESLTALSSDVGLLKGLLERVDAEKRKMVPDCFTCACPCGKNSAYDMNCLLSADEDVRSLKGLILLGLRGLAADAQSAAMAGRHDKTVDLFFYKALTVIGIDSFGREELIPVLLEMGKMNLRCVALLVNPVSSDAPDK